MSAPTSKDAPAHATTEAKLQPVESSAAVKELLDFQFVETELKPRLVRLKVPHTLGCS